MQNPAGGSSSVRLGLGFAYAGGQNRCLEALKKEQQACLPLLSAEMAVSRVPLSARSLNPELLLNSEPFLLVC